ncbi:unnamed protein product [Ectocarpus fasciculatus]
MPRENGCLSLRRNKYTYCSDPPALSNPCHEWRGILTSRCYLVSARHTSLVPFVLFCHVCFGSCFQLPLRSPGLFGIWPRNDTFPTHNVTSILTGENQGRLQR